MIDEREYKYLKGQLDHVIHLIETGKGKSSLITAMVYLTNIVAVMLQSMKPDQIDREENK